MSTSSDLDDAVSVQALVQQFLLGRLEGLSARQVAVFVQGWCSALDVLRRTDLCLPKASLSERRVVEQLLAVLDEAQAAVLSADEDA